MEAIWRPSAETLERANLSRLMRAHGVASFPELLRRSREEPDVDEPGIVALNEYLILVHPTQIVPVEHPQGADVFHFLRGLFGGPVRGLQSGRSSS